MAKTKVITKKQPRCTKVEITFYSEQSYRMFLMSMQNSLNVVLQDMSLKLDRSDAKASGL